jgi:large subunit ribosomal protein L30
MARVRITLVRSAIGRSLDQKRTVAGLGLRRLNHSVVHEASLPILGMARKISHLVRVEEVGEDVALTARGRGGAKGTVKP